MNKDTKKSIKQRLLDLWALFKELLLLVASLGFIAFGIIGVLYTFGKHILKLDYSFSRQLSPIVRGITLANDGFGNSAGGELLNDVIKPKIKFGKWYQTISAVTGINYLVDKTQLGVTKFKNALNAILGKNHCEDAITENDLKAYEINYFTEQELIKFAEEFENESLKVRGRITACEYLKQYKLMHKK